MLADSLKFYFILFYFSQRLFYSKDELYDTQLYNNILFKKKADSNFLYGHLIIDNQEQAAI